MTGVVGSDLVHFCNQHLAGAPTSLLASSRSGLNRLNDSIDLVLAVYLVCLDLRGRVYVSFAALCVQTFVWNSDLVRIRNQHSAGCA